MNEISQGIEVELNRDTLKELGYSIEENKDKQKIIKKIIKNGQEVTSLCIPATYIYHGLKYKITTIGENIFSNCIFLKEIELPDSIVEIKETAFWDCESLTKITFPKNLVKINKYAFQHCKSLQTITIPDSVTEIGVNAFSHCESLISVKLSKNLTKISKNTFFSCKSLQDIIYPDYLTEIAERSFWCCKSLQSIKLPDSIIEIGESAFSGCEKLNIIVPENIKEIGKKAFQDCLNVNCKGKIKRNCGAQKINNKLIKKENEEKNEEKYKKILYTILTLIFFSCFISIFQPIPPDAKVHSIYFLNFLRFAILTFFIWLIWLIWKPEKKNKIRESTLNNSVLKALGYKKYDNSLNNSTIIYYNEQEITSLNIPSVYDNNGEKCKITKIGNDVFSNCTNLIDVKIPDSIIKIEDKAFLNCTNLKNINIPDSVKEIGEEAFLGCNSLSPEIRKKILNKIISDEFTFKIETNDKINKRVRNCFLFLFVSIIALFSLFFFTKDDNHGGGIGCSIWLIFSVLYCVLYWWPNRCEVNNRTLKSLGYKNKFKVPIIEIPKTYNIKEQDKHEIKYYKYKIIRIGDNAFKDCKNLKQITIPDSISEIGKNAFNGCTELEKLIIPDSVFEIGENAFKDVENVIYNGNAIGSPWGAKNIKRN